MTDRKPSRCRRVGLHIEIARLLQGRALTAIDLGAMLEKEQAGVDSALRGMERRGEVIRMSHPPGTWAKWALRGGDTTAFLQAQNQPEIRPEQESADIARAQGGELLPQQSTPASATTGRVEAFPGILGASSAVTLVLPSPLSANRYWRSFVPRHGSRAIVVVSDEAKAYRRDVLKLALAAGVRKPVAGRVALGVRLYPARPLDWAKRAAKDPDGWDDTVRSIDLDNALKVLLDALKNVAFEDDAWVRRIDAERCEPDEHGARVVVTISPLVREAIAPGLFGWSP